MAKKQGMGSDPARSSPGSERTGDASRPTLHLKVPDDWQVVPVGTDKIPLFKGWPERATSDRRLIKDLLEQRQDAALAVHLGKTGLAVLDVEGTIGGAHKVAGFAAQAGLEKQWGALPRTATATTPSGGRHLYFRDPGGLRSRIVQPGVEVRAGKALACIPTGSRTPGRTWEIGPHQGIANLPSSWIEGLGLPPPPPPAPPLWLNSGTGAYARAALEGELRILASASLGSRNATLHLSAVRLGSLVGAGLLHRPAVEQLLEHVAGEIGLPAAEARPTIASGMRYGLMNPREVTR